MAMNARCRGWASTRSRGRMRPVEAPAQDPSSRPPRCFLRSVPKIRLALTFLATTENDGDVMKTLAVISILALLTIAGAVYTDQILPADLRSKQGAI